MNLQEFQIAHSAVIEHYQFIESHLEGIYAALTGKHFYEGLKDVERYSLRKIIRMIQEEEKRHKKAILSDAEYALLDQLCQRRNYWVHNCYTVMLFDHKTDAPKRKSDIEQLRRDTENAQQMRELLHSREIALLRTY